MGITTSIMVTMTTHQGEGDDADEDAIDSESKNDLGAEDCEDGVDEDEFGADGYAPF